MIFAKNKFDYDLIILGSGAAGSVAAHYARSLKKTVAIFEENLIGGDAIHTACIPAKTLIHAGNLMHDIQHAKTFGLDVQSPKLEFTSLLQRKASVIAKATENNGEERFANEGITIIKHKAHFVSPHEVLANDKTYSAAHFLIATGAVPYIPLVPGLAESEFLTYKQAFSLQTIPSRMLIYGGGRAACEIAQTFVALGTRVTILTKSDRLLSDEDEDVSDTVKAQFKKYGVNVITTATITKITKQDTIKSVYIKREGKEFVGDFETIIVACGKIPNLDFSPEKAGLTSKDHTLRVKKTLQTNVAHIYAAGDVVGPHMYTNIGSLQSYVAAKNIFSKEKVLPDYSVFPRCLFTSPQVATVGITEQEAKMKKMKIKIGIAPISTLDRAITQNVSDGFIKIITNTKGIIIGGTIIAPQASEMIHEITLAIKCRVMADELADMIHVYPSYSEGIKIACSMIR